MDQLMLSVCITTVSNSTLTKLSVRKIYKCRVNRDRCTTKPIKTAALRNSGKPRASAFRISSRNSGACGSRSDTRYPKTFNSCIQSVIPVATYCLRSTRCVTDESRLEISSTCQGKNATVWHMRGVGHENPPLSLLTPHHESQTLPG